MEKFRTNLVFDGHSYPATLARWAEHFELYIDEWYVPSPAPFLHWHPNKIECNVERGKLYVGRKFDLPEQFYELIEKHVWEHVPESLKSIA
jgi:hypothetical protein